MFQKWVSQALLDCLCPGSACEYSRLFGVKCSLFCSIKLYQHVYILPWICCCCFGIGKLCSLTLSWQLFVVDDRTNIECCCHLSLLSALLLFGCVIVIFLRLVHLNPERDGEQVKKTQTHTHSHTHILTPMNKRAKASIGYKIYPKIAQGSLVCLQILFVSVLLFDLMRNNTNCKVRKKHGEVECGKQLLRCCSRDNATMQQKQLELVETKRFIHIIQKGWKVWHRKREERDREGKRGKERVRWRTIYSHLHPRLRKSKESKMSQRDSSISVKEREREGEWWRFTRDKKELE